MAGNSSASGIIPRTYKSGSIIYFENDRADNIYILKEGRIILTSIKLDTGEEIKEDVRIGEFFGVKSALGKYPREETAQTHGETTILVLRTADFEKLILKNVTIVRKMLRVFSNQLRRIHKMVQNTLGQTETSNPAVELFKIGEYYLKTGVYQQAMYAYKKYMEHYPDTQYASTAMQRIREIESGNISSTSMIGSSPSLGGETPSVFDDLEEFGSLGSASDSNISFDTVNSGDSLSTELDWVGTSNQSAIASDLDNFLSDDALPDFNDFSFDDKPAPANTNKFEQANSLFEQQSFNDAATLYKELLNSGQLTKPDDVAKATLNLGRSQAKLGQNKDALTTFNEVVKNYPSSPKTKNAYFEIGAVLQAVGQNDKAIPYYKKAASTPPRDALTDAAMAKIKQLQG